MKKNPIKRPRNTFIQAQEKGFYFLDVLIFDDARAINYFFDFMQFLDAHGSRMKAMKLAGHMGILGCIIHQYCKDEEGLLEHVHSKFKEMYPKIDSYFDDGIERSKEIDYLLRVLKTSSDFGGISMN